MNVQPFDCNFIGLYIDWHTYPAKYVQPNFPGNNYVEAYRTLAALKQYINVSLIEFKRGYTLFIVDINENTDFTTKGRGDCRLELRFGTAFAESVTLLMY